MIYLFMINWKLMHNGPEDIDSMWKHVWHWAAFLISWSPQISRDQEGGDPLFHKSYSPTISFNKQMLLHPPKNVMVSMEHVEFFLFFFFFLVRFFFWKKTYGQTGCWWNFPFWFIAEYYRWEGSLGDLMARKCLGWHYTWMDLSLRLRPKCEPLHT